MGFGSGMRILAALPRSVRYAIFAFPMVATLLVGALYLGYAAIVCDPLYAYDAHSAGYESGIGHVGPPPALASRF